MSEMKDKLLKSVEILVEAVMLENAKQIDKWGIQKRTPFEWLAFLTEEVGELAESISEHKWRHGKSLDVYKEAIQVATLSLKIAEMYLKEGNDG